MTHLPNHFAQNGGRHYRNILPGVDAVAAAQGIGASFGLRRRFQNRSSRLAIYTRPKHSLVSGMPLHWTVESRLKLIIIVAERDVTRSDVEGFLNFIRGADIGGWPKLIDARDAHLALTITEVNEVGVRLRTGHASRTVGPLAVVMPAEESPELARLLGFLAAAKRPMRLFQDYGRARKWIAQPVNRFAQSIVDRGDERTGPSHGF